MFFIYLFLIFLRTIRPIYWTYSLYQTWISNDFSKFYLPPHQSINYFIQYAFFRFWSHFLAALIFSLVILLLAKYFNKRSGEKYFWPEEIYFIAIAILIVGYPGWLVYFLLILIAPLIYSSSIFIYRFFLFNKLRVRMTSSHPEAAAEGSNYLPRISYYHLWLSLAVLAIIISRWLSTFGWWVKLTI